MIENYKDHINFPTHISNIAKDFIMSCLWKNPFYRKNVYKLLKHPFITSNSKEGGEEISNIKHPFLGECEGEFVLDHKNDKSSMIIK